MIRYSPNDTQQGLVPLVPELLVSVRPPEAPVIEAVTPQIAAWVGRDPQTLLGYSLADIFDPIIPALSMVVEEVFTSGHPVRDYRVTFQDEAGIEHTVRIHASLRPGKPDSWGALVAVRIEELPTRPEGAEALARVRNVSGLIGRSQAMMQVFRKIEIYGPTEAPVVITGETGTGKELVAHALHAHSKRQQYPFVAVNCAALSEELLESELFGHERGAFTSAMRSHRGRFERANGGTLFLDEIGEMPLRLQVKLLRVLEEGVIERVGGEREISIDVRLLTATNVPLEAAVQAREFRLDLYHRLEVLRIHMPPLREHPEDIPVLVEHFLKMLNHRYQRHIHRLTPEALHLLQSYSWPGNIRELRNVLERVYVETTADVIGRKAFDEWVAERSRFYPGTWDLHARHAARATRPPLIPPYPAASEGPRSLLPPVSEAYPVIDVVPRRLDPSAPTQPSAAETIDVTPHASPREVTREHLVWAYRQAASNITQAAKLLGMHKASFYRRLKALGMSRNDLEALATAGTASKGKEHE
jgi:transcriptional regulator with GAF, ATPase, and Fis domain